MAGQAALTAGRNGRFANVDIALLTPQRPIRDDKTYAKYAMLIWLRSGPLNQSASSITSSHTAAPATLSFLPPKKNSEEKASANKPPSAASNSLLASVMTS